MIYLIVSELPCILSTIYSKEKRVNVINWLCKQGMWLRRFVYYSTILGILILVNYAYSYIGGDDVNKKKPLPFGVENFENLRQEDFYYVDKTMLIWELLENWAQVSLITRPRRF